jgi:transposase
MKLIELINLQSLSISKAAKTVSIKLSTAKLIIRRFMEEGTFFEKRS